MSNSFDRLDLGDLGGPNGQLSRARGAALAEAAAVILEDRDHEPGVTLSVYGHFKSRHNIIWPATSTEARASWNDIQDATEHGAYACAIILLRKLAGLVVLQQSRKGTGFDWWLGSEQSMDGIFQGLHRLEVSGILQGTPSDISTRLTAKMIQLQTSASTRLPGWAVIVEFGSPVAMIVLV